jgi:ABC-type branched-subunit amino acid transport system ATPase component
MSDVLLEIAKVSKHFGGLTALSQVDFQVERGRIKGLIGPNGAGKTTLFNMITGLFAPSSGSIRFRQKPLEGKPSYQIARAGIARTFQDVKLFPNLTVLENVLVGCEACAKAGLTERTLTARAWELLGYVGLGRQKELKAGALPFGQQRLMEIARALAIDPKLMLLDEPAAGLSIPERGALAELIRSLTRDLGITVLLVEHDMDLVLRICDEIVVLEYGTKIAEGPPRAIVNDRRVVAAYLGEEGP